MVVGAIALVCAIAAPAASGQPGALDRSFGGDGRVTTNIGDHYDAAYALAIQSDGKLVAAGETDLRNSGAQIALTRYRRHGRLDAGFGSAGRVVTNLPGLYDYVNGIAIQPDGKIVAVGTGGFGSFAVVRFTVDGSLDTSFSGDGRVLTSLTPGLEIASGVVIQSDGRIIVVGPSGGQSGDQFGLVRYNSDGSLDSSFGGDGIVRTNITGRADEADAVRIQSDGKIVVSGMANSFCCDSKFALARFNTDGTLDTSFSGDGKVTTNFTSGHSGLDGAFALALQADEKIVAAGPAGDEGSPRGGRFGVARYDDDGTPDATFSGDGKVVTNLSRGVDRAFDVELQADGMIVVGGAADFRGSGKFAVVRYLADGHRDSTFSRDGKVTTNISKRSDVAYALAIQPDGAIAVAGVAGRGQRDTKFALARYRGT